MPSTGMRWCSYTATTSPASISVRSTSTSTPSRTSQTRSSPTESSSSMARRVRRRVMACRNSPMLSSHSTISATTFSRSTSEITVAVVTSRSVPAWRRPPRVRAAPRKNGRPVKTVTAPRKPAERRRGPRGAAEQPPQSHQGEHRTADHQPRHLPRGGVGHGPAGPGGRSRRRRLGEGGHQPVHVDQVGPYPDDHGAGTREDAQCPEPRQIGEPLIDEPGTAGPVPQPGNHQPYAARGGGPHPHAGAGRAGAGYGARVRVRRRVRTCRTWRPPLSARARWCSWSCSWSWS